MAIAEALGRRIELLPEVAEISFGDWDGYTVPEVRERWGDSFEVWRGSWELSPPNGESLEAFDHRIQRGVNDILANHGGETVVVVSHVMPIRGFVKTAMDAGIAAYWRPQISPCSITVLRLWGRQAAEVVTINSTGHLAE
jgi:probable phosphoglycerate mutase